MKEEKTMKVSFDFDKTLSRKDVQDFAKELATGKSKTETIYRELLATFIS